MLRKAGATVRNQNLRTNKIVLRSRSNHYDRARAASDESGRSRRCQCAQADCESLVARSRPVSTTLFQLSNARLHSRFPDQQRDSPTGPPAAELRNRAAAILYYVGMAPT